MQDGDLCCVLNGTRVPYILRPKDEQLDGVELVGECYVPGLMFGEVGDMLVDARVGERTFTIC
jgi:hypothetical protein